MNAFQEHALRTPWTGDIPVPSNHRQFRERGDGTVVSLLLTVERCGCLNHGYGIWHASALVGEVKRGQIEGLDREDEAVGFARSLLEDVGDPDWELVLWASDPGRRVAHVRVACTPSEGLLISACPIALNDHEEEGVWVARATKVPT